MLMPATIGLATTTPREAVKFNELRIPVVTGCLWLSWRGLWGSGVFVLRLTLATALPQLCRAPNHPREAV